MPVEIVNPVPADELEGWSASFLTTFLAPPDPARLATVTSLWGRRLSPDRTWGARDGGRWVATLGTEARTITVPGPSGTTGELAADALTAVSTAGTHRRQGILTRMLGRAAARAKDGGDAVSLLLAAEWPIYGRYGYGPAALYADYEYSPRLPRAAVTPVPGGSVRQIPQADIAGVGPAVFDVARRQRAGQVDRRPHWWARLAEPDISPESRVNVFVHESDGRADGLLTWKPFGDFDLAGNLGGVTVVDLVAATPTAYRNLWAYLSGIDVVDRVVLKSRPVDEPVRWLLADGRALRQTYAGDFLWVRFLDVAAALASRTYSTSGRAVLDVHDPSAEGFATGRWVLDGGPDGATCTPTTEAPDVSLPSTVLASAWLGGYQLTPLATAGRLEEHTPGAVALLDAMTSTAPAPWCQTAF